RLLRRHRPRRRRRLARLRPPVPCVALRQRGRRRLLERAPERGRVRRDRDCAAHGRAVPAAARGRPHPLLRGLPAGRGDGRGWPRARTPHLAAKDDPLLLLAGQLAGVEGHAASAATGILAGITLARLLAGEASLLPPPTTMLGALSRYVHSADPEHFQPMNANV